LAKIKYDVKGVERGRDFEQPKPGLYTVEIVEANARTEDGKNDIELVIQIIGSDFDGSRLWTYVGLGESTQWKLAELTDALGLPEKGTIDTDKLLGKKMKVKVNADTYNNEYRARAGRFAPLEASADEDVDAEDDPDDPDAEDTDTDGDEGEAIVGELNGVELSSDPEYYDDWDDDDVFEEVENQSLGLKGKAAKNRDKVIAALVEKVKEELGGGDDDDDDDKPDYSDEDEWTDAKLKKEIKSRELEIKGKATRAKMIAALEADDEDDDDPFDDD